MGIFGLHLPKKVDEVVGGIGRQVNPFDGGATYNRPNPQAAQQRSIAPAIQNARYGVLANNPTLQNNFINSVGPSHSNPITAANQAYGNAVRQTIVQPIARTVPEAILSLQNKQSQYTPGKDQLSQALFGNTPVENIQRKVVKTYQNHPGGGAIPLAAGEAAYSLVNDLPVAGAALKGVKVVGKPATQAAAKGAQELSKELTPLNQVGAIGKLEKKANVVKSKPEEVAKLPPALQYSASRKGVNALNRSWLTVAGTLNKYGPTGEAVVQKLHGQRNAAEVLKQRFYNQIPTVLKLDKHDMQFFADALENVSKGGKLDPGTPPHIQKAIKEWNGNIQSVRDLAAQHGLDVGDLGPNYFPRIYKNLDSEKGFTKLRDTIMADAEAKGRPISVNEASNIAESIRSGSNKSYGNLEKTRQFDVPGYEKTHDAVTEYVNRAFDRITRAEQFGANDEFITQAYRDLQSQGYTPDHIENVFKKYVDIARGDRDHNGLGYKTSSVVRKFNALTSLSAAGISNSTQSTNTAAVGGMGRTLKAIGNMVGGGAWGSEARQKAQETGVLLDHAIASIAEQQLGTNGKIARNIASPFFKTIERFNRQVSAMVGADYGNHLASAGKHDVLREKFGITGKIGDKLTPEQETQMARKMVEISQFKVDPMDLPGWADSALGKLAIQFRTFGYKQTEFMYNQVAREAMKGNFAPLARFVAVGVPAGVGANKAREVVQAKFMNENNNDNSDQSNLKKAAGIANTGFAQVGGYGLPGTAYVAAQRASKSRSPTASIAGAVGGPTVGFATETAQNVDSGARYGNWQPLGREVVRKIPAVGPTVANVTMPYKASDKPTAPKKGEKATPAYLEQESKKEMDALKNRQTVDGYSIQQLSNGKYAYTLNGDTTVHTAATIKKANQAVAKDAFGDSEQNIKLIGDTVYRKNAEGTVSTMSKTKYEYQLGTQELERYKRNKDLGNWTKTAEKQLASIDKQLQDPNVDELDKISLQNDADALMQKMQKYGSDGMGGSGGSGGGSSKINPSSYSGKISVSVAKSTPARTPTISKVAVKSRAKSGKIKVTAKKVA